METPLCSPGEVFRRVPCICGRLLLASRAVTRLYNEELRRVGMEVTQYALLRILEGLGPMTQQQLADRLATDKTTVSRSVRRMEGLGWVKAQPGPDRRSHRVTLTARGRAQIVRSEPAWLAAQARLKAVMTASEYEALWALLPGAAEAALRA